MKQSHTVIANQKVIWNNRITTTPCCNKGRPIPLWTELQIQLIVKSSLIKVKECLFSDLSILQLVSNKVVIFTGMLTQYMYDSSILLGLKSYKPFDLSDRESFPVLRGTSACSPVRRNPLQRSKALSVQKPFICLYRLYNLYQNLKRVLTELDGLRGYTGTSPMSILGDLKQTVLQRFLKETKGIAALN